MRELLSLHRPRCWLTPDVRLAGARKHVAKLGGGVGRTQSPRRRDCSCQDPLTQAWSVLQAPVLIPGPTT